MESVLALPGIRLAPIEPSIAIDSVRLPGDFHADPADRIIVATARFHQATLLTADRAILSYGQRGYVQVLAAD
jgi:PIN domain nuclease of toxin-antitoxin system